MRSVLRMLAELYFGLQRTRRLKATLHWVQDFARVSEVPTLEGLTQESFKAAISIAAQRADIRKKEAKDASSVSSEALPGKLKDDKKWQEWITGFENMLSTLLGVNDVPLLYVIREKEETEPVQHTFNLFKEEDEPLTESAKFRFLTEKVQDPQLKSDISALKVKSGLGGTSVLLTEAANLIAALVASKSRISLMNQTDASKGAESIYRNGRVYTGYYKKLHALSQADQDKVMAERDRQGIKKGPQKKTGCQVSFAMTTEKEVAATKRKLKKANRKISSLWTKGDGTYIGQSQPDASFRHHGARQSRL